MSPVMNASAPAFALHQLEELGLDDWQNRVADPGACFWLVFMSLGPECELAVGKQVFRIRKRRHPASILKAGVPADVIHMQMSAHDIIDLIYMHASGSEAALEAIAGHHVPKRACRTRLPVADAAIN